MSLSEILGKTASVEAKNDDGEHLAEGASAANDDTQVPPQSPEPSAGSGQSPAPDDDRQWRQTLERQVTEMRARLEAPPPPQSPAKQKTEAELELEYYANPTEWTRAEIARRAQEAEQRFFAVGVRMAAAQFSDYGQVIETLINEAQTDPSISARLAVLPPESRAFAAYQMGKEHIERQERSKYGGSIDEIRKKIRAEIEQENKTRQAEAAVAQVTPSTAGARGSGSTTTQSFEEPTLSEILAGRKFQS